MTTKITTDNIQPNTVVSYSEFTQNLLPKVSNVSIANSTYAILDDTAVNVGGGYIVVTGGGFQDGATVLISGTQATAVSYVNSSTLHVQVPSKSAATYNLYVVNPDGGTAIGANKLTYSGVPTWVTDSTLSGALVDQSFNVTFDATGATSYSNTTALPAGTTLLSNGYFYGAISSASTYNFTIRATDNEQQDADKNFSITIVTALSQVDYLVVAGGGGGGSAGGPASGSGGGGGAGGLLTSSLNITLGTQYTVTIGAGGSTTVSNGRGVQGGSSVFASISTVGGGGGGGYVESAGSGGSGGGGTDGGAGGTATTGQGFAGGQGSGGGNRTGGGGGGSAGVGISGSAPASQGGGGPATDSTIGGSPAYYGGGGSGGSLAATTPSVNGVGGRGSYAPAFPAASAGVTNTGSGGGGGGIGAPGGAAYGGSGVVIIRYPDNYPNATTTGSPTFTTTGGYKIYKFTGSGTITFN